MMHYKKGRNVEPEMLKEDITIDSLPTDFLWMHVKGGTRVSNVITFASEALKTGKNRSVVWSGVGGGVGKAISCAEIMKRGNVPTTMYQATAICYREVEEYWDPQVEGLEQIVVKRKIPCVHILLSLDEIDSQMSGYQLSTTKTPYWVEDVPQQRSSHQQQKQQSQQKPQGQQQQNPNPNSNQAKRIKAKNQAKRKDPKPQ